jgi:hypothetical protein
MLLGMEPLVRESLTADMTMRGHLTLYGQFVDWFRIRRAGLRRLLVQCRGLAGGGCERV